tara:strand:- start:4112 stop:5164 length:1053 start_codon:yes stop_codon:yes gene_type:complete
MSDSNSIIINAGLTVGAEEVCDLRSAGLSKDTLYLENPAQGLLRYETDKYKWVYCSNVTANNVPSWKPFINSYTLGTNSVLEIDGDKLKIKTGNGLFVDATTGELKIKTGDRLIFDDTTGELKIKTGYGISINNNKLTLTNYEDMLREKEKIHVHNIIYDNFSYNFGKYVENVRNVDTNNKIVKLQFNRKDDATNDCFFCISINYLIGITDWTYSLSGVAKTNYVKIPTPTTNELFGGITVAVTQQVTGKTRNKNMYFNYYNVDSSYSYRDYRSNYEDLFNMDIINDGTIVTINIFSKNKFFGPNFKEFEDGGKWYMIADINIMFSEKIENFIIDSPDRIPISNPYLLQI